VTTKRQLCRLWKICLGGSTQNAISSKNW